MRLLRANTEDLELVDVPDGSKKYAILSHRWLPAHEEVTYADITSNKGSESLRQKRGWKKLDWCRQQAVKDGLKYVWADTACIDKSSSQELTESINAMYRWYKEAECCYVYLHDMPDPLPVLLRAPARERSSVPDDSDTLIYDAEPEREGRTEMRVNPVRTPCSASPSQRSRLLPSDDRSSPHELTPLLSNDHFDIEAALDIENDPNSIDPIKRMRILSKVLDPWSATSFEQSEWFTRAWTLQEMLASGKVRFYNKSWLLIGDLSDLSANVANITGVHEELLTKQRSLDSYSIAQKMSWAAMRKSTKIEDRAYSLLGIMNVSIGIVYGEAKRAFLRLQEEILRVSSDDSIFAFRATQKEYERQLHQDKPFVIPSALLAESPDPFRNCGNIVRAIWHQGGNQHQPAMREVEFRRRARTQRRSAYVNDWRFPEPTEVMSLT